MKWLENRHNVVGAPGSSHQTRSCVLDWLQSLTLDVCNAMQQDTAVVEAAADEGVNQRIRRLQRQWLNNTLQLEQPEIAGTANGGDVVGHRKPTVDHTTGYCKYHHCLSSVYLQTWL